MSPIFNAQPNLEGETLRLAPLAAADYGGLLAAASDPLIWAVHPVKDRWREEVFRPYFRMLLESETALAVRLRAEDEIVGVSRYYQAPGCEGDICIGFTFLRRDLWGGTANWELKTLMLGHAFQTFERVWFHIGPDNIRSQKATAKLGAVFARDERINLGRMADQYHTFRLDRGVWTARLP